nr:hypothetical protein [Tanacetum cinerariifolium]
QSSSPQLDNDDLKKIDADDLVEMDLKWQMAMLIVECYNCHRKGHFARECRSHKDTRRNGAAEPQRRNVPVETSTSNALVSQCDGVGRYDWSFQAEDEPTNYALMAFSSSSSSSDNELRDNALVSLRQNLDKAEQERDDLKLMLEKFQTSSKNLRSDESFPPSPIYDRYQSGNGYHAVPLPYTGIFMPPKPDLVFNNAPNDIETDHPPFNVKLSPTKPDQDLSHTHRPLAPIIEDWVSNSEDESETQTPHNVLSFVPPVKQVKSPRPSIQHVKTSIPAATPKPKTAQPTSRNHAKRENHKQYAQMKLPNPQRHVVPAAVLTPSKLVPINTARPITAVVPKIKVTRPRQDKSVVTKPNSPPRRHINHSPSPKSSTFPPKVNAVKAPKVNAAQPVAPTTVEHRLARKNKLKARGTLLMALTDKDQLKFNTHKDAKTLIEALEKRFGGNTETKKVQKTILKQQYENFIDLEEQSLDDLFNSLKIYKAEVKSFSSTSTTTQNIAFVSSSNTDITKEPVSAAASVSAISANLPVSALLNVDSLSNAVIYSIFASQSSSPQLDNDDLKKIDADDLVEMDLKWQMAMLIAAEVVSQLEIHGVSLSQEDVNLKFLRSLPTEWKTHTLIWRNKTDLEDKSLDDLFNSLKIYESEVKHSSSQGSDSQNLAFVSTTQADSTNDSVSAAVSVSAVGTRLSASTLPNVDSLSNAVIYSFFASQSS